MPVHGDELEEYRVRREKDALLKSLGISMDANSFRELGLHSGAEEEAGSTGGWINAVLARTAESMEESFHMNLLRLLCVQVLQNELIHRTLRRIEEAVRGQSKSMSLSDWK